MSINANNTDNQVNEIASELTKSWYDAPINTNLNPSNVMTYFCQRTNPFYDRRSNNELCLRNPHNNSLDLLRTMQGIEYDLIYHETPILFVIQKRRRHSPTQVTPIATYYIIAGVVYRAPDLNRVISSRLAIACNNLNEALAELTSGGLESSADAKGGQSSSLGCLREVSDDVDNQSDKVVTSFQTRRVDQLIASLNQSFTPSTVAEKRSSKESVDAPDSKKSRKN